MKKVNLKAVAYSLLMSALYFVVVLALERKDTSLIGSLILFVLFFTSSMLIMWNNNPMIFYFWKAKHDFVTSSDRLLMIFLGTVIYIAGRYVYYIYVEEGTINPHSLLMCLSAAAAFRKVYLNHAPDDVQHYESQRRQKEENETFVTVAVCKDAESAHIINDLLETNGIESMIYGESAPSYLGNIPIRVLVKKKDKETAEGIINE